MSNATKTFLIMGTLLVLLVGGRVIVGVANPQDDKTLIQQALADSIKASREGRPGGVMEKLSDNIKFNGQNENGNQRDIARYIRESKPDVVVENTDPTINGDEATIVSPVHLSMSMLGQSIDKQMKGVTLVFRKENDRDWLIIPVKKWKLAEVQVPDAAVSELALP